MSNKQKILSAVLDGKEMEESSVLSELINLVKKS
jgi:hypothetical protein